MKVSIFMFFILTLNELTHADLKEKVLQALDDVKQRMCRDIDELSLPTLEPFALKYFSFNFKGPGIGDINIEVEDFKAIGLKDINLPAFDFNIITLNMKADLTIPKLYLTGQHKLYGNLAEVLEVDGAGPFELEILDFYIKIDVRLQGIAGILSVRNVTVDPTVSGIKSNIQGIFPTEELNEFINEALEALGNQLIVEFFDEIRIPFNNFLIPIIDGILSSKTLTEWLLIIANDDEPLLPELGDVCDWGGITIN